MSVIAINDIYNGYKEIVTVITCQYFLKLRCVAVVYIRMYSTSSIVVLLSVYITSRSSSVIFVWAYRPSSNGVKSEQQN